MFLCRRWSTFSKLFCFLCYCFYLMFLCRSLSFFLSLPRLTHTSETLSFLAFWLQGPATAGSFVPPPSALSPPPSSAPPTHGHLSHFSFPTSSSSSPPSSLSLGIGTATPVPPARTYAAAHRLQQPFSEEQFRLKLLHRNQTIVEVHSQPGGHDGEGPGGAGSGFDADVDMQLYTPPAPPLLSSSSSSCKPLSVVPEHGDGVGRAANVVVKSGGTAPMVAPVTTPVRPTTLNLCSGCFLLFILFFLSSFYTFPLSFGCVLFFLMECFFFQNSIQIDHIY